MRPVPVEPTRREEAIALDPDERLAIVADFADLDDPVGAYVGASDEMVGLLAFMLWEIDSQRLDPEMGSDWWKAVNGQMLLDMEDAARLIDRYGDRAKSSDDRVQAWIDYHRGSTSRDAQELFWVAHQRSLHGGIDESTDLLLQESIEEREFIEIVVKNVDASALLNFPSDNVGGSAMYAFISGAGLLTVYPDYGDSPTSVTRESSWALRLAVGEAHDLEYDAWQRVDLYLMGANSGGYWQTWTP